MTVGLRFGAASILQSVILQACMTGRQTFPFVAACKQSSETDGAKTTYFQLVCVCHRHQKWKSIQNYTPTKSQFAHGGFCGLFAQCRLSMFAQTGKARKCSCEFSKGQGRNKLFPSVTAEKIEMS